MAVLLFWPGDKFPDSRLNNIPHLDKVVHFFLFAFLEFFLLWDFQAGLRSRFSRLLPTLLAVGYGFFTEAVQHFFALERSGSSADLLADIAGCIAGVLLYRLFLRIRVRYFPPTP